MDELKLPIIKGRIDSKRQLSMDDYAKFVDLNLKYTVDREANKKQKRLFACTEPFSLI